MKMNDVKIRDYKKGDLNALVEIYRPYVEKTSFTFEYRAPTSGEFEERIKSTMQNFPFFVAELEREICGYAYAGAHRSRCAYGWSVESSVYIDSKFHGQGIGKKLYQQLFKVLKKQRVVNVFAGITLPNDASVGLHESMGFKRIGVYKKVGFKNNQWWDVGWWQLSLQNLVKPIAPIPYSELR